MENKGKRILATGKLNRQNDTIEMKYNPTIWEIESTTLLQYIIKHRAWSKSAFGEGERTEGLMKHIEKEIAEVRANPNDLMEVVDIIILAIDCAWRMGYYPDEIVNALLDKQRINKSRKWPQNVDKDLPTEHIRD